MSEQQTTSVNRFVRWAVLLSALVLIAVTAGIYCYVLERPALAAEAALAAAFSGDTVEMQKQLDMLKGLNEPELYYSAILDCARMADYNGNQELALELLEQPEANETENYAAFWERAQEQMSIYTYHQAMALYETGEYARAARVAAQVRQYEPAASLYDMAQSAYQATLPTPIPTIAPTPTPEPTALPVAAVETPAATPVPAPAALLPEGRIATGFAHTVVLMEDGTVRAFGDNSFGQLEVGDWQNVVYVAAGAYHTLGLTADGRVLACGDQTHLQTDVTFYTGVKAIAAGDYASFLLLDGGQVMATGYLGYEFLGELTGAQAIGAGSYGLLVKTADGMIASHPGIALEKNCELFAVSRGYAVGADKDGNTFSTTALLPQWTGVKRLAASENAVVALREDGTVLSHIFGRTHQADFRFDQPVLAAAAAPNHYAFLLADGTLEIRYANGQKERIELK